jgi:hypothetical protein
MIEKMLLEALYLASENRKTEARWLLKEVLRLDRGNETAWLWLSDCSVTPEERISALEFCLRHNPDSQRARVKLARLRITAMAANRRHTQVPVTGSERTPERRRHAIDEPPSTPLDPKTGLRPQPSEEWLLTDGASVFTVSPEELSQAEFAEVEAHSEKFLQNRPDMRPLKVQLSRRARSSVDWTDIVPTNGKRRRKPRSEKTQPLHAPARKTDFRLSVTSIALFLVLVTALAVGAALMLNGV